MSKKHLPNMLSGFRILMIPVFLYFLFSAFPHGKFIALLIFAIASITDAYDGRIARKYGFVTKIGVFLDPLADKFLVLSAFISLWVIGEVQLWMLLIISARAILITGLRIIMQSKGITMITSKVGKLKTTLQLTAIHFILVFFVLNSYQFTITTSISTFILDWNMIWLLMFVTTIVTAYTGLHYFYYNFDTLKNLFLKK